MLNQFDAGTKNVVEIPVATLLNGTELSLFMHVIRGVETGPTLALLSTSHGAEFLSIEQIRAVISAIDPTELKGTVLAIPVANPPALEHMRITTPQDELNMNRIYPGQSRENLLKSYAGGLTEYIAHLVTTNLIDPADLLIDFHQGPWCQMVEVVDVPSQAEDEQKEEALTLANLFGITIHDWHLPPGSAVGYAASQGKLAFGVEMGGAGFGNAQSREWVSRTWQGIKQVMVKQGMLQGDLESPPEVWVCTERAGLRPLHGGYHEPCFEIQDLGSVVEEGAVLGRTYHMQSFEVIEEIKNPYRGILYLGRGYGPIHPGDWGYVVGNYAKARKFKARTAM